MTAPRFTAQGKQVLFEGEHFADACDETAALAIVTALNAGWQPIETAPRDGTHFLACRGPYSDNWGFNQSPPMVVHYWPAEGEEGFYLSIGCVGDWDRPLDLSHWMPLPDAPTPSPSVTREGGE